MSWSTSTQRSPPPRSGRLATLQPRRLTPPHALIATATLQPPRLAPPHALIATATLQPRRLASRPRPPHASPTSAPRLADQSTAAALHATLPRSPSPRRHAPGCPTPRRPAPRRRAPATPRTSAALRSLPLLDLLHRSFPLSTCRLCRSWLGTCCHRPNPHPSNRTTARRRSWNGHPTVLRERSESGHEERRRVECLKRAEASGLQKS
jgi:hypothetical protein